MQLCIFPSCWNVKNTTDLVEPHVPCLLLNLSFASRICLRKEIEFLYFFEKDLLYAFVLAEYEIDVGFVLCHCTNTCCMATGNRRFTMKIQSTIVIRNEKEIIDLWSIFIHFA